MTRIAIKTTVAALTVAASAAIALPASANTWSHHHRYEHQAAARIASHHHAIRRTAYRDGYSRGFRDGHYAAVYGRVPGERGIVTGRSAYVAPGPVVADAGANPELLGNGGLLGLGVLGGNGVLGSGVLDGRGALGLGVLGL